MGLDIFLTIFLVLLNGFFVAAEFAIVKVRTSQVETKNNASKNTSAAKSILENLDGYLAATQLGITLASLGLGWVGEDVVSELILRLMATLNFEIASATAHKVAIPVAFATITVLHIVFGELAPKSLAIRKPAPTTFVVAIPLRIFYFVFRPFIWVLNGLANGILKLIGIQPVQEHDIHTEEELKIIVTESQKGGVIDETEKDIIHNVFNLSERKITSLMTPRQEIVWLDINDELQVTKRKILENKHHVYPLCENDVDNVVGFVYSKDLLTDNFDHTIANIKELKKAPFFIPETNRSYQVLENFRESKVHHALIVDEFGSVIGIVTINDIFDALVGDISETDEFEYEVVQRDDGSYLVDGQIPFEEFLQVIEKEPTDASNGDFVTLGGFILERLKKVPEAGDRFTWDNHEIEVIDMDGTRIDKVLVKRNEEEAEDGEELI